MSIAISDVAVLIDTVDPIRKWPPILYNLLCAFQASRCCAETLLNYKHDDGARMPKAKLI